MHRRTFLETSPGASGGCVTAGQVKGIAAAGGGQAKALFEPVDIGGIPLRNRLLRSATFEYALSPDAKFAGVLAPLYAALARGEAGAIISGMMAVNQDAPVLPTMVRAYGDSFADELSTVAKAVHDNGGKLVVQLAHCGLKASPLDGAAPCGPSAVSFKEGVETRAMSEKDIADVAAAFAQAAYKCREAGADGVQMHCAHGYLLSQFLSPYFNKRTDAYGGDIVGRARIVFEVYTAIRKAVGNDYPIWMKINSQDLVADGFTVDECLWVCGELANLGLNAVEISGGLSVDKESSATPAFPGGAVEGYFAEAASRLAGQVSIPVISVCGYRTTAAMQEWLDQSEIAAFSLCRPFVAEPDLAGCWRAGYQGKARCISCNKCFTPKDGIFKCQVF